MLIAVASRDGRSVAGHIGKCADWIVYAVNDQGEVSEQERIHLSKEMVFHHFRGDASHLLDACSIFIGASAGDSFIEKMQARGMQVELTAESDPATAVTDYVHQTLAPPRARPIGSLICKLHDALSNGK